MKFYAKLKSVWVRKLIGKLGVPYNRRLRVRGSPHPLYYVADLSLPAADSNAFRNQSGLPAPDWRIAALICFASGGVTRTENTSPLAFCVPTFGLPILFFIIIVYKYVDVNILFVYSNVNKENDMANILKTEKKVAVVSMLAEGSSMASVARITGIHPDTIMRLAVRIGQACAKIQDEKMRGLTCNQIEVDEIWGFIGAKRKNAARAGAYGDVWTFIALDADTKLIPSFIVGKRDSYHAKAFMEDLARRLSRRVQLTSDAMLSYPEAVERSFGSEVDYGQLVKTYGVTNLNKDAASRYSSAEVVKAERTVISGMPDVSRITTSHVEKQNHTLRMHCRRLTRLTNAFSKKFENFQAAVALNFAYYNFCKTHKALRMTPAMAAGIETSHWTVEQLIKNCGE
jgi:IS1 family transposase